MPDSEYYKTIDPKLYSINLYYNKDYYQTYSNYYKLLVEGLDNLQPYIDYEKSLVLNNPVGERVKLYKNLDSVVLDNFDQIQFKVYWYEKFFNDLFTIQEQFNQEVQIPNYFRHISDSIGLLRNYFSVPDDSTLPVKDVDFTLQFAANINIPTPVGSSAFTKLRDNTQNLIAQMMLLNTSLYRKNIEGIQNEIAYSNTAHGENLVTDFLWIDIIGTLSKDTLEKSLRNYFGKLYDLVLFYENFNYGDSELNLQQMDKGAIEIKIQGVTKKIGYLKDQVTIYKNSVDLYDVLGARPVT